jgi:hypothetical protein
MRLDGKIAQRVVQTCMVRGCTSGDVSQMTGGLLRGEQQALSEVRLAGLKYTNQKLHSCIG